MPLTALRADPFDLDFDDLVTAKVSALNANGEGDASEASGMGAAIQTEPI